jgi:hypothetical protein
MKTLTKYFLPEILANPINRDLILIFAFGLLAAVTLVSSTIIILNQL